MSTALLGMRPLLRGVLHEAGFFVALVVGVLLGVYATGVRASVAAAVFAGSVVAMFGASALYHRVWWSVRMRPWMRRSRRRMRPINQPTQSAAKAVVYGIADR